MGRLLNEDDVKEALYDAVDDISRGYYVVLGIEEDKIEEIIESVPSAHLDIPSDTISRCAAKKAYCKHFCHLYCYRDTLCSDNLCKEVNEAFDEIPSA